MWLGRHFRGETPIPGHAWLSDWSEQASLGKTVACPKWPCWSNGACWCHGKVASHELLRPPGQFTSGVAIRRPQNTIQANLMRLGRHFRSEIPIYKFQLDRPGLYFQTEPLSDLSGSRACLIVCWSMGIFAPTSLVPGDLSSDDAGCHGTLASRELLRLPGQITLGKHDRPWKGSTHPNALPLAAGACIHGTLEGSACTGKTESCRRFHKECSWCSNAQDDGEIWIHIPDGT